MKLVIDSSILIDFLRGGKTSERFFKNIREQNPKFFIPTIVIYELFSGKSSEKSSTGVKIINLIDSFERIELTEQLAISAGELYRKLGSQIGSSDYIIAASALSMNAQVVTLNTKHFEKIPGINLYNLGFEAV